MRRALQGFCGHLGLVLRHKYWVARYCFAVGLYKQGLVHDLSKFSWTEFRVGMRYFQGNRSPNDAEREHEGISYAWLHHKGRNKHHLEYWTDYSVDSKSYGGIIMPLGYVVESICDRMAATRIYNGNNYDYQKVLSYFTNSLSVYPIHPCTKDKFLYFLAFLSQNGEKKCLDLMRMELKKYGRNSLDYAGKP